MNVKEHFSGIQTAYKRMGESGCLFLALLSICEEYCSKGCPFSIDIYSAYKICMNKGYIDEELYVKDSLSILYQFTGVPWTFKKMNKLPATVPDAMYTIEKWYNPRTGFTHFKRRGFDTLESSVTVKEGSIIEYYTYTHKE